MCDCWKACGNPGVHRGKCGKTEGLKKHFNVRVVDFILSRKNLKRTLKIFEKKSIVVAGGYDKCLIYLKS